MMRSTGPGPSERGFTLIEMMTAVAIFSIITLALMSSINVATDGTELGTSYAVVQNAANSFAEDLMSELYGASRGSVTYYEAGTEQTYGSKIQFQVAVEADPDGEGPLGPSVLDASGQLNLGSTLGSYERLDDPDGVRAFITYEFVARDSLVEGALGVDINGDNDKDDTFQRGYFRRSAPDSSGTLVTRKVSDVWFVMGDWDDDTVQDHIFFEQKASEGAPARVGIDLRTVQLVGRHKTVIAAHVATSVMPQNK